MQTVALIAVADMSGQLGACKPCPAFPAGGGGAGGSTSVPTQRGKELLHRYSEYENF